MKMTSTEQPPPITQDINHCRYVHEDGKLCKNKLGPANSWFCRRHNDEVLNVVVKKSQINKGGLGLYAGSKGFKKGERIARYGWDHMVVGEKELEDKCERTTKTSKQYKDCFGWYTLCNAVKCWDGRDKSSTTARFANDCHGTGKKCNAHFQMINKIPWIVATKAIKAGEEVFCNYGPGYWSAAGH